MTSLPRGLKTPLLIADVGFFTYWALTAFVAAGLLNVPGEYLYNQVSTGSISHDRLSHKPPCPRHA